ncbi:MAG: OmpA family protein [Pseudorhodobacter sp.]
MTRHILTGLLAVMTSLLAIPALAFTPVFPAPAKERLRNSTDFGTYLLPLGPWADGHIPAKRLEGRIDRQAWTLETTENGTLAILANLREQARQQGYEVAFECATAECGGFDFRFGTEILPEPEMHVDLGDFRFLSAQRADGTEISILVSRSELAAYVQLITLFPTAPPLVIQGQVGPEPPIPARPEAETGKEFTDPGKALEINGNVVLEGLSFASGETRLPEETYPELVKLAAWLLANPEKTITLVGHTDASGGLDGNVALSRQRAAEVRRRLIEDHQIPSDQIAAEGVGYLSPRASNQTEEGRTRNRRVEAVLTSID